MSFRFLSRGVVLIAVLGVLATVPLFASGAKEATAAAGPQSIQFVMWQDPTYANVVQAYNDSQSRVKVDPQIVTSADYETKLTTMLAGGVYMDAFMEKRQTDMFAQYENGYIEPLDGLIKKYKYDTTGLDNYKAAVTIDGKTLAIPFRGARYYIYYNKKMFADAGIDTPDKYVQRGDWTWKKFMEVAEKISSGDGKKYGAFFYTWGQVNMFPAIQANVSFITPDGKIDINDTVLQSFKMRKELEQKKAIMPYVDIVATKLHYSQAFYNGNVAMLPIGEWFPGFMLDGKKKDLLKGFTWDDWGVTRLPDDQSTYASVGAPTFNNIYSGSKFKDAAFDFIGWMGGAQGSAIVAKNGFLPGMITPDVVSALKSVLPDNESLKYFTENVPVIPPYYTRYGSRVEQAILSTMQQYLLNDMSDAEVMAALKSKLQDIINTTN
ncbi:MAG TPA: extracellular solute-binding protein [Spirochaetia bacterium]|nr:extracellular solute-binding protein [Spirochaetia bacterium]